MRTYYLTDSQRHESYLFINNVMVGRIQREFMPSHLNAELDKVYYAYQWLCSVCGVGLEQRFKFDGEGLEAAQEYVVREFKKMIEEIK